MHKTQTTSTSQHFTHPNHHNTPTLLKTAHILLSGERRLRRSALCLLDNTFLFRLCETLTRVLLGEGGLLSTSIMLCAIASSCVVVPSFGGAQRLETLPQQDWPFGFGWGGNGHPSAAGGDLLQAHVWGGNGERCWRTVSRRGAAGEERWGTDSSGERAARLLHLPTDRSSASRGARPPPLGTRSREVDAGNSLLEHRRVSECDWSYWISARSGR